MWKEKKKTENQNRKYSYAGQFLVGRIGTMGQFDRGDRGMFSSHVSSIWFSISYLDMALSRCRCAAVISNSFQDFHLFH